MTKHSGMNPCALSSEDWTEVLGVPEVREAWGLETDETPETFASRVYAAKFDFVSGGPGYCGDLYMLYGDALTDSPPMILMRNRDGKLTTTLGTV